MLKMDWVIFLSRSEFVKVYKETTDCLMKLSFGLGVVAAEDMLYVFPTCLIHLLCLLISDCFCKGPNQRG